jgi:hypothetical protein
VCGSNKDDERLCLHVAEGHISLVSYLCNDQSSGVCSAYMLSSVRVSVHMIDLGCKVESLFEICYRLFSDFNKAMLPARVKI